eukprot:1141630-Amphidinium_carterae.1
MPAFGKYVAVKILTDKKKLGTFTPQGELICITTYATMQTCSSWVISDGNYTEGQIWVEHSNGTERPP